MGWSLEGCKRWTGYGKGVKWGKCGGRNVPLSGGGKRVGFVLGFSWDCGCGVLLGWVW